ncbi:MAG: 50S ribosomal protein L32e [Thermoplasmata archaeon]|nr:50S ribosomal protein L32e [Thermoplasmata archaeon]MCI4359083.1 50S ribosomal protein L32e [Thermoplasmata archaeon]
MADPERSDPAEPKTERPAKRPARKDDEASPPARRSDPPSSTEAPEEGAKKTKKASALKAPRRPTLEPELARLLSVRGAVGRRRPKFVRTASHRYWRIGRWASWRRPRGLQSKQRRHYGYRPVVVSVGFRSPKRTRGLTPTGFIPVIVQTTAQVERLERNTEAAVIARSVGTRRRLVLEETARKLGVRVLNPITSERKET